jgi:hypothetical protein
VIGLLVAIATASGAAALGCLYELVVSRGPRLRVRVGEDYLAQFRVRFRSGARIV